MTELLIRIFIKNPQELRSPAVRKAYGTLVSVVSILCNLALFAGKFLAGTLFGSIAIAADAVNNLTDAASNLMSLVGFKLASRPADPNHPFGHARFEYLSGLGVAVLVLVIGVELARDSIGAILHPEPVVFSWLSVAVLSVSILVKLWMARFNRSIGRRIGSTALEAAADDSRNDVLSTGAVLAATLAGLVVPLPLDGWMGLAVACFILYSGWGLIKETVDPILGVAPSPELVAYIQQKVLACPGILGVHDLMVHDYGPGCRFASLHVEMSASEDVLVSHDRIDQLERAFLKEDGIHAVIHFDPILTGEAAVGDLRSWLQEAVRCIHPGLTVHDLRTVPGTEHTTVIFDCVVPAGFTMPPEELRRQLAELLRGRDEHYVCKVTIENSLASIPHTAEQV